tara:strand:- start:169950 stop:170126 length:177 start_codon:yes stop_codon:yes gene_type:complete
MDGSESAVRRSFQNALLWPVPKTCSCAAAGNNPAAMVNAQSELRNGCVKRAGWLFKRH